MSDTVSPLLMLDLEGLTVSPVEKDMLAHPGAGGLILFTRNYQDRQQLAELVRQIREIRPDMLIAVDQEGGRVQRFREGFVRLPPMAALGRGYASGPEQAQQDARLVGELMASELTELDIDISFAPVLDLDYPEDSEAGVDGNFVMTGSGKLIEVQMSAEGSTFTRDQMNALMDLADKGVADLVAAQKAAVGG